MRPRSNGVIEGGRRLKNDFLFECAALNDREVTFCVVGPVRTGKSLFSRKWGY